MKHFEIDTVVVVVLLLLLLPPSVRLSLSGPLFLRTLEFRNLQMLLIYVEAINDFKLPACALRGDEDDSNQ